MTFESGCMYRQMGVNVVCYLVISKNSEDMKLRIRSEALALSHAGNNPSHKGTMSQPWRKNVRQTKIKDWVMHLIWTIHLGWFIQLHSIANHDWLNMFKFVSWHTLRTCLTIIQCFLIGPVGSFLNILKVRVLLTQPSVKYCYLNSRACIWTQINRNASFNANLIFKRSRTLITVEHLHIISHIPVCPICQSTSACSIWATCLGMARRRRRLECLPVACQNPEPRDRLVLLSGLDDCQDCHFCTQRVSLHGDAPSVPAEREKEWEIILNELYFIQLDYFICAKDILQYKWYWRTSTCILAIS